MKPSDVIAMAKERKIEFVDMKFTDFLGSWQHFSIPVDELTENVFEEGLGIDGSSIRGWLPVNMSDLLVVPDPTTAVVDPFMKHPTLSLVCDTQDPITLEPYGRDPRHIAKRAEAYLKSTGIGDVVYFGPEAEFFVFDEVRYALASSGSFYSIDSEEAAWNTGIGQKNLGSKIGHKAGYFPVAPHDSQQDLRSEMCVMMAGCGIQVERQHHESATAGQAEIDIRFDSMLRMADKLMLFKYIVRNTARRFNKTATFMPKPVAGDSASGMHTHMSIWRDGKPLFAGDGYAGMSEMALHYIGGILKHGRALAAFANPTTNSYKRLVPGFEAPVNLAYSSRNRSAAVRIPMYSASPKAKRLELRSPDPSCNPYLAFSAMLMAGLDGIQNRIDPGEPLDKDIYGLSKAELKAVPKMPGSLDESLEALEADHEFLLKGDVFSRDLIETWIDYKREHEIEPSRLLPTPKEFDLYFDA